MSTSKEFDFYKEMKNVKVYYRYMPGTVILSAVLLVGVVTKILKICGMSILTVCRSCSFTECMAFFSDPVPGRFRINISFLPSSLSCI